MTSKYMYTLEDDIMYKYDFHEPEKLIAFLRKLLESRGGLYISKEMLTDFYKYILVDLLDDIDSVSYTHLCSIRSQ